MQVSQVDLKALGIDILRGRAKEGTGWPENNRDEKWDWKYYCLTCKLEVKRPYLCKTERTLNKSVYSPENPNWSFNRPPSLRPRCPQCKELDKLITKEQRIDWYKGNIAKIYEEQQRLKAFQKKWKKFRKKHYDLLFNNNNLKIPRESLQYKDQDMWQCHVNLLEYIEDYEGMFMPRSESTKEDLKLVWELDHKYSTARRQNEQATMLRNSGDHELKQMNYPRALEYYNRGIAARIDRTDLYLARSELYFVTGQYEKCITDCSIIIYMIDAVHLKQRESGAYVNAYYNRAKANKFLSKLQEAKRDLEAALVIDDEHMECRKLLSEINTLLLLNKEEKDEEKDEDMVLFEGGLKFLKTAEDKTADSEYKLFSSLFGLMENNNVYYVKFVSECNGIDMLLQYMRSKFKASNTKSALKDLGKPGLDIMLKMVNVIVDKEKIVDDDAWITKNMKLISNNILYIFTLCYYMDNVLQSECLTFAASMMNIKKVKQCISVSYGKPLMERFRKINRKMGKIKGVKTAVLDDLMLQCMLLFDEACDYNTNNKIASMYNMNGILYQWMVRYIAHCNTLKRGDKEYDICFKNLFMILDGVHDTVYYVADASFYILYDDTKNKEFGYLMQYVNKLKKKIHTDPFRITAIVKGLRIWNALADKEHGRKYMLQNKALFENMNNVLTLIQNNDKELYGFMDNIFRRLIQQQQDNEEQREIEEKQEEERKERMEEERKEKEEEERLEKLKKEKERKEREVKEAEERKKPEPMDGDLDALSDDDEDYFKEFEENEEKRKEKEQKQKRKQKKKKKKKKKEDDSSVIKTFVSKRAPAKFDENTMQNVFGDKLSMNEIKAILSINPDK